MSDTDYGRLMGKVPQGPGKPDLEIYLDGVTLYFVENDKILKTSHIDDLESLMSAIL